MSIITDVADRYAEPVRTLSEDKVVRSIETVVSNSGSLELKDITYIRAIAKRICSDYANGRL